jgi:hypothetical protein
MTTTEIEVCRAPGAPAEPSRLWRPTADPDKTVPPVEVDLTAPRPGYALGVAIGAALAVGVGLVWLCAVDLDDLLVLVLTGTAFLTSLVASHAHQLLSRS